MTEHGVKQQLKRLEGAYKPPTGDGRAIIRTWMDALDDVTDQELDDAVTRYIKGSSPYHPRPGQLRQLVLEARPADVVEGGSTVDDRMACAVCGAPPELLFPDGQPVPEAWKPKPMPRGLTATQMLEFSLANPPHPEMLKHAERGWVARVYYRHNHVEHERAGRPVFGEPPHWQPGDVVHG